MKRDILAAVAAAILTALPAVSETRSGKKVLDHADFDRWEKVTNYEVSNNGEWAAFAVNPQEGDGKLFFHNTRKGDQIEIKRGYRPKFSADGKWAFALVKPFFQDTRKAKINKKKGFDMPQDSLAIVNLKTGAVEKIGNVISYKVPENDGEAVAWLSSDTTLIKPKALKDEKAGKPLNVRNLSTGTSRVVNWVKDYTFSKDGGALGMTLKGVKGDTLSTDGAAVLKMAENSLCLFDRDKRHYGAPVFNEKGDLLAYTASNDSNDTGTRKYSLFISEITKANCDSHEVPVKGGDKLFLNQYSKPQFSHNGKRLVIGVAPQVAPDDTTLVSFENPTLDIWRWDAPMTPPQENNRVEYLRSMTFPVVIDFATGSQVLMTDNPLVMVSAPDRWDGDWALLADRTKHGIEEQWEYQFPIELRVKNVLTGEEKDVATVPNVYYELSPADKYVLWFSGRQYHCHDIATGQTVEISELVDQPLWDTDDDHWMTEKEPYGVMGWTDGDAKVMVYDKYDVICFDPQEKTDPVCLTNGEGRKRDLRLRWIPTDPEFRAFKPGDKIVYKLFEYTDKRNGLASQSFSLKPTSPKVDFLGEYSISSLQKAKDANEYSWIQANFSTSPNVYVSDNLLAAKTQKVSNSNPWMHEYNWGTAQLFRWHAYDGKPSEGVLYLPEDFDPNKEYPLLCYFYETYSQDLFEHYDMEPSWSWINFPFYASRGYVIFVPDIHYTAGIPGENAYNYVCSGVEELIKKYPNIDKKRVGIDGQSWGGYQTAFLVTRTNMFACAGSGAPVANMTSAFGGIRWESGDSRQGQYEKGQSRIGQSLFEAPELYIYNSPVFHADRCNTPLLIMHNDADGAVPWYQGIEMFMALRRLQKPVWMLEYNGEAHNLKERRNRKDITKRLQQFFDHYLMGAPMPEWMKNGIPAIRKGQELGY